MLYFNDAVIPTLEHSKFNRNFQISLIFQQFHEQQVMNSTILGNNFIIFHNFRQIINNFTIISQHFGEFYKKFLEITTLYRVMTTTIAAVLLKSCISFRSGPIKQGYRND